MRFRRLAPFPRRRRCAPAVSPGRRCAVAVAVAAACGLAAPGGLRAGQAVRAISVDSVRGIPRYPLRVIADYEWALATTVSVLEKELNFPPLGCTVLLVADKPSFRESLIEEGHSPRVSADAAEALGAVASARAVRINQRAMLALAWPERVQVLAHELTHIAQNQLSGGRRGTSDQWLREGVAMWVSLRVLEILGHGRLSVALREARATVGHEGRKGWRPRLADLSTFEGWAREAAGRPAGPLYDQALLATNTLIEARGLPAALDYFSRFAGCDDREANFLAAFHEEARSFEIRFDATVTALIRH